VRGKIRSKGEKRSEEKKIGKKEMREIKKHRRTPYLLL